MALWIIFWELVQDLLDNFMVIRVQKGTTGNEREGVTWNDRLSMKSTRGRCD